MGSVKEEITRLETAKKDIETAIETCGVNVPDTELIDTYASYIRQIPSAVFSGLNVDPVGGADQFIQSIKQTNGLIEATVGGLVSTSNSGLVPKADGSAGVINSPSDDYVLTYKGGTIDWYKLPANAFKNDDNNTTYTFTSGNGGFTVTPSNGSAQTVSIGKPATAGTADKLAAVSKTAWGQTYWTADGVPTSVSGDMTGVGVINGILNLNTQVGNASLYLETASNTTDYAHLFVSNKKDKIHVTRPLVLQLGYGNVGIGVAQPSQKLDVDGNVKATSFIGNLDGNYINKLTGYTKATSTSALAATDTLNAALGKLEYKTDVAYNLVKGAYDGDGTIENLAEILKVLEGISDTDTIQAIIGKYLPLAGGTMTGNILLGGGNAIIGSGNSIPSKFTDSAGIIPEVPSVWIAAVGDNGSGGTGGEASGILFDGNTIKMWSPLDNAPQIIDSDNGTAYNLLHSGNSSVSKSGQTLTVKINGQEQSITNSTYTTLPNPYNISFKDASNSTVTYNGSSALDLTGGIYHATTSKVLQSTRYDNDDPKPNTTVGTTFQFSNLPNIGWSNVLTMKSYTDNNYTASQLITPAGNPGKDTGYSGNMQWRQGRNSTWLDWKTILDSSNTYINNGTITINGTSITPITSHQDLSNYVTLNTAQTITGAKTFANTIYINSGGIMTGALDLTNSPNSSDGYKMGATNAGHLGGGIHFKKNGANDWGQAITWSHSDETSHAGIYVKSSGAYGTKMYLCTTNLFVDGAKAALEIDASGKITALRNNFVGNLTGNASTASSATIAGDGTMTIVPQYNNEINFGGTNASSTLYFGYRATGSKPIPTAFVFGGASGSASITASKFIKSGGTSSQFLKADGSVDSNTYVTGGPYLPLAGGVLTGPVTFANGTWNVVGDDAAIGDYNTAGSLGLKSVNNNIPSIGFHNSSNTLLGTLKCDAGTLKWNTDNIVHGGNYNAVLPVKLLNDPGQTVLKNSYGLNANYGTSSYGHPTEEYLKAFAKYLQATAPGYTCIGYVSPNSRGAYVCDVYNSGTNSSTGLPEHITGHFFNHGGTHIAFGTSYGKWYYYSFAFSHDIPTKVSQLTNDLGFLTSHQSLANYVTLNTAQTISATKTFSAQQSFTATGKAPFTVSSDVKVDNLNADFVDGYHVASLFKRLGWNSNTTYTDANTASMPFGLIINQQSNYTSVIKNYPTGYGYLLNLSTGDESNYSGVQIYTNHNTDRTYIRSKWGSTWYDWKTLAYTSDIPTSLPANGGNSDTVDNLHAADFVKFYLSPMTSNAPADSAKSWFKDTMPAASGAIVYNVPGSEKTIIAGKSSGAFGHMLQLNYDDNYLRLLRYYSGSWQTTDWEKISAGYADSAAVASYSHYANVGGGSSDTHDSVLKSYFNSKKASIPRNSLLGMYSGAYGNGSYYMGYFLSGYDSAPYGGFFVAQYNNPYYVGISNGTYTTQHILTSTNYTNYTVQKDGTGASGTWGINITGNAASATTTSVLLTSNTAQTADACYSGDPGLRFWRFNGTGNDIGGGDGYIMSWSWNPGSVGGQIYLDDNPSKIMAIRGFDNATKTFNSWSTFLHSSNYTDYTVKKDGTGASGTWGISISGTAANANTLDSIDSTGFLRYYNSNAAPSNVDVVNTPSYVWTVSTTGGTVTTATKPSGMDNAWGVIHLHTHVGDYATQLGFGGTTGRMYMRNAYNTSTFGNWKALAFTSDIPTSLPANGGNADTVDNYHAGLTNGSVAVFVPFPSYTTLKNSGYIDANYGTGSYGHPDEEFLKGICKWAIATYPNQGDVTLMGIISPNSSGTCILHLYSSSGKDSTTKLPRYCRGQYLNLSGYLYHFGTVDYVWSYNRFAFASELKNPTDYYWADQLITSSAKSDATPTFGRVTSTGLITAQSGVQIGSTSDIGWYFYNSRICAGNSVARGVNTGSLLVSSAWADDSKVPTNGIYSKGNIITPANVQALNLNLHGDWETDFGINLNEGSDTKYGFSLLYGNSDLFKLVTRDNGTASTVFSVGRGSTQVDFKGKVTVANRLYPKEWIQFDNATGLYWPNTYGAHFYPNDTSSYGQFRLAGSKNGYSGIHFGTGTGYLTVMDNGSDKGAYQENWGWLWYFNARNGKLSLRTSSDFGADVNINGSVRTNSTVYSHGLYHLSYGSSAYALTSDGGVAHIGSMSVNYANYAGYLPTCYAGGQQTNPQTYFSNGVGVKVAMTGMSSKGTSYWSDTLWVNGYSGGDVPNMCALHFNRDGTPRMFISAQSNQASSYGTFYEVITGYNIGSQSVNYATSAGSAGNANTLDGYDSSAFAKIGTYNNLTHTGNEFTFASSAFSGDMWINYRTASGSLDGAITGYYFGDGKGGSLAKITSGNFSGNSNSASKLILTSCYGTTTNGDLWSTIKTGTTSYLGTATVYEVYNNGGPDTYGEVLDIVSVHNSHWQPQLWFGSGKAGRLRYRNKDYNDNSWGDWKTVAWTSEIPSVGNGTVTITQNGVNKGSFTMNQSGNTTINLTDNDTNTWREVQCNGTSIGSNTLNLKAGSNVSLSNSSGAITITATDTNYYPVRYYTSGLQISTYSGSTNCALYVPHATTSQDGVINTADQSFKGNKTFTKINSIDPGYLLIYAGRVYKKDGSTSASSQYGMSGFSVSVTKLRAGAYKVTLTNNTGRSCYIHPILFPVFANKGGGSCYEHGFAYFSSGDTYMFPTLVSNGSTKTFTIICGYMHTQGNWNTGDFTKSNDSGGFTCEIFATWSY